MAMSANLEATLRLARAAISTFVACAETKRPLIRFTRASIRTETGALNLMRKFPGAVPAINLAGARLVVADLDRGHGDGADGIAEFEQLLDQNGELPAACPMVRTPRGGVHIYFRLPDDAEPIGNSVGQVAPGIDIRGFAGFVIAPDAVMADGTFYEGIAGTPDLCEAFTAGTIPPIPEWLAALAEKPAYLKAPARVPSSSVIVGGNRRPLGVAILEGESRLLAATLAGERNMTLNKAAFVIASKAGAWGWVSEGETWDALFSACLANGYIADDGAKAFRRSFYSGWNDGLSDPTPPRERLNDDPEFAERIANLNSHRQLEQTK
jgi:hypothetical protein